METRVITIVSTAMNGSKRINSQATTLGELKADLRANGINYNGMTFMEGLTRTIMADDNAILPTNVERKGTVTNNLVFMLTNNSKRIKSGSDLNELRAYIRNNGLAKAVSEKYNKNFTQCTIEELKQFIATHQQVHPAQETPSLADRLKSALTILVDALYDDDLISSSVEEEIKGVLTQQEKVDAVYSDEDLCEIIDGIEECNSLY